MIMNKNKSNMVQMIEYFCNRNTTDVEQIIKMVHEVGYDLTQIENVNFLFSTGVNRHRYISIVEKNANLEQSVKFIHQNLIYEIESSYITQRLELTHYQIVVIEINLKYARILKELEIDNESILYQRINYFLIPVLQLLSLKQVLEICIDYSKKRVAFDVPIHKHQLVYQTLADSFTEYTTNKLLLIELAKKLDKKLITMKECVRSIIFLIESQQEIVDKLVPTTGAYGLIEEAGINSRFLEIHGIGSVFHYINYV